MKCEIIGGKLVIERGTPTEVWAVQNWFGNMTNWQRVSEVVSLEPVPALPVNQEIPPHPAGEDDELNAIFGPKSV